MSFTQPHLGALGAEAGREWLILWSLAPGTPKPALFSAWVWASRSTAALLNRTARGQALGADRHQQYRLEPPVKSGYAWYRLKGTTWGTWWKAESIDWVYANSIGFMAINGGLQRDGLAACKSRGTCQLLAAPSGGIL